MDFGQIKNFETDLLGSVVNMGPSGSSGASADKQYASAQSTSRSMADSMPKWTKPAPDIEPTVRETGSVSVRGKSGQRARSFSDNEIEPTRLVASNTRYGGLENAATNVGTPNTQKPPSITESFGVGRPQPLTTKQQVLSGATNFFKSIAAGLSSMADPDNGSFSQGSINQALSDVERGEANTRSERDAEVARGMKLQENPTTSTAYARTVDSELNQGMPISLHNNILARNMMNTGSLNFGNPEAASYFMGEFDPQMADALQKRSRDNEALRSAYAYASGAAWPKFNYTPVAKPMPDGSIEIVNMRGVTGMRDAQSLNEAASMINSMDMPSTQVRPPTENPFIKYGKKFGNWMTTR